MKKKIEVTLQRAKNGNRTIATRLINPNITSEIGINHTAVPMIPITIGHIGQRGIDDFKERTKKDVVDGYSMMLGNDVVFGVFILSDHTYEFENIHKDAITLAGNATQAASFLRGAVQSAQAFAHTTQNFAETYKHFYGPLSEDQLSWMNTELPTFEQAVAASRQRAQANAAVKPQNDEQ